MAIKIGSGITPTGGANVYKEDGRPLVRSQNIGWGRLLLDDIAYIDERTNCRPCGLHGYKECPKKHFNCAYGIETKELLF